MALLIQVWWIEVPKTPICMISIFVEPHGKPDLRISIYKNIDEHPIKHVSNLFEIDILFWRFGSCKICLFEIVESWKLGTWKFGILEFKISKFCNFGMLGSWPHRHMAISILYPWRRFGLNGTPRNAFGY